LSKEEISDRARDLITEIGLSHLALSKFRKMNPNLCNLEKAKRRMQNLKDLGFDAYTFIEINPKILDRRIATVRKSFDSLQKWSDLLSISECFHDLTMKKCQPWSTSSKKFDMICSLAEGMEGVTFGRVCNMCAENIENILCVYIIEQPTNFREFFTSVRKYKMRLGISKKQKQEFIKQHPRLLPETVYGLYTQ
jgi:hypothetical protein